MNNPYYINTGLGNVYKSGGSFKKYKKAVKKLYDAYLWGSPETELTKKEYKKYKKDLWEGLNQSKEVLASLNKEELKHPTNEQLVESYNNDNEIPLDYNYNVFNTARRDKEQALLDAYNYNQSLLTPGQKAANSVAARNNYRGLSYLMNVLAASPLIFAGVGSVGEIYKILTHPLTDAALTAHGAITAPSNIREGIKNIKEGNTGEGIFNLGMTALDLTGAGQLVGRTGRMFNKAYRAKHAYNTIAPAGYGKIAERGKEWIRDLWYNPDIDLYNPKWYKAKKKDNDTHRGFLKTGDYLAGDVLHAGEISDKARMDAWAIYNGLPQPYNTYIKNADGTYSYDMKRIMDISENTWHPTIVPKRGKRKTGDVFDFVTGSGGGLTDFQLLADDKFGNGIMRIEDTWDLHPFSRDDQLFNIKLGNRLIDKFGSQNRRNAVQKFREKMFDMGIFGLDRTPIQRLTYPIDRVLNKYRMGSLAPTFDVGNIRIYGLTDKIIHDLVNSKAVNKVTDYLKNFEVGKVSGGGPFIMRTDIPFHDLTKDPSGAYLREIAEKKAQIEGIDDIVNKLAAQWEFSKISPYKYGFNPNYIANPQPYFLYDNNSFKINTDPFIKGNNAYGGSLDANPEKPPVNVDLDYMWNSNQKLGNNRMMNRENMEQLDNFFIEKGLSLPQRQALLYTILQESGADSLGAHGNGYYGLVGWSGPRYNAIKDKSLMGQAEHLYNTLFNGNGKVDWNYGGDGSGYASWTDAQKAFLSAQDFDTAMRALTYGYVRPSDENKLYRIEYGPKHFAAPVSEEQTPVVLDLNTKEGFDDPILLKKINKDMNEYSKGGTIHIKPENKGKFTAAAKRAGKSVQGYASQILANPDNYSSTLVKRANFAHVFGGRNYEDGGPIDGWDPTLKKRYPVLEELYNKDAASPEAAAYRAAKIKWDSDHPGEPYPQYFHQRLNAYIREKQEEADAKAIERAEKIHNAIKSGASRITDWAYDKFNNRAYGGKLYPNGGPLSMDLRPAIPPQGEIIPGGVGLPQYYTPLYAESPAAYEMRERMKDYYIVSLEDMLRASREKQMLNSRSDNGVRQSAMTPPPGNYSTPPIVMPNFISPYSIGQSYAYPDMNDPAIDPLKGTYSDFRTDSGAQVSERTPSAKTNTGSTNNGKSKVPAKQRETVAAMWSRITGLPWKKAKELGLTDGSYAANIDVLKNLKNGNYTKESINALVNKQYSDYDGPVYMAEPEIEDAPVDAGFYSEPPEVLDMYDPVYPSDYDNHMAAYGGRFFRDGGPTDPPWMNFTPSKARSPQVIKPQPQVNPYLLGLASGSGRVNPSVQYTAAAQTPEFQQGMRDAEAAFASNVEFKDNTKGEEGARAVSPVLSVIPGTGDVKDFSDIVEYYQNTGNLGSSLGMAAFTVLSPVQGVAGKFGKWLSKPWKERGKFRKSFDITAPLSAGIAGGAYVYDRVSTNNRNFTPPIDEQKWMEKDSVTLRNEALKNKRDSLDQVERYNYLISQGYSPEEALAILYGEVRYE